LERALSSHVHVDFLLSKQNWGSACTFHELADGLSKVFQLAEIMNSQHAIGMLVQDLRTTGQWRVSIKAQERIETEQLPAMPLEPLHF
jgi:hypothetical protein